MNPATPRLVSVREGHVRPSGSWLYVWVDVDTQTTAYVGGTAFDPELRAYLHLASEDPDIGRIRATVPQYDQRNFDVLAFELPDGVDRAAVKELLVACLAEPASLGRSASDLRDVISPILQALDVCRVRRG